MRTTPLLSIVIVAAALGAPATAAVPKVGPWLGGVTKSSITVSWMTTGPSTGYVQVKPAAGGNILVVDSAVESELHHVVVSGLTPGAKYGYSVHSGGAKLGEGTFRTAPLGQKPFRFLVYGDNRDQHEDHAKVVSAMLKEPEVDFVVNTGDLVSDGGMAGQWQKFLEIEGPLIRRAPLFPVVGNHDELGGEAALFEEYLVVPPGGTGTYYAFTYANARFVVLDHHVAIDDEAVCALTQQLYEDCFDDGQVSWLLSTLEAAKADPAIEHVFVVVHIGPYSSKEGRNGSGHMRKLLGTMKDHGTRVIFSGHDHVLEHGISGNGIPYVVSGGGGAPLYDVKDRDILFIPHEIVMHASVFNYLVVDVDGEHVSVVAKDIAGEVLTSFEAEPPPECATGADCAGKSAGACAGGQWQCVEGACTWVCPAPPPPDEDAGDQGTPATPEAPVVPPEEAAPAPDTPAAPEDSGRPAVKDVATGSPPPKSEGGGRGRSGGCRLAARGHLGAAVAPLLLALLLGLVRRRYR